jgi:hypothetical protein
MKQRFKIVIGVVFVIIGVVCKTLFM